jgi:hypothetical protein
MHPEVNKFSTSPRWNIFQRIVIHWDLLSSWKRCSLRILEFLVNNSWKWPKWYIKEWASNSAKRERSMLAFATLWLTMCSICGIDPKEWSIEFLSNRKLSHDIIQSGKDVCRDNNVMASECPPKQSSNTPQHVEVSSVPKNVETSYWCNAYRCPIQFRMGNFPKHLACNKSST